MYSYYLQYCEYQMVITNNRKTSSSYTENVTNATLKTRNRSIAKHLIKIIQVRLTVIFIVNILQVHYHVTEA